MCSPSARGTDTRLYLIAVRTTPAGSATVRFSGLPLAITQGTVLAHAGGNPTREVTVANGACSDLVPYAAHDSRVYRFAKPS
jgi:hypothetical protein